MIPGGCAIQVFDRRRRVIRRRSIDANDPVGVSFEPRPELEPGDALPIHGYEMQAVRDGTCSVICRSDRPPFCPTRVDAFLPSSDSR